MTNNVRHHDTDKAAVTSAFADIRRKLRIQARQNFWCCKTCASHAFGDIDAIYYHGQDADYAWSEDPSCVPKRTDKTLRRPLMIRFQSPTDERREEIARTAINVFEKHGLKTRWDGDHGHCIEVLPA